MLFTLHRASHVPVGEDQRQHIELTRELAEKFNRTFGEDYFPACEVLSSSSKLLKKPLGAFHLLLLLFFPFVAEAKRVMSLRDGTKKMSKSEPSEMSRIALKDDPDTIAEKIRRAKTDLIHGVSYDVAARPEVSNLVTIFSAVSGRFVRCLFCHFAFPLAVSPNH
jgi:tryptophanyl-tRNA synthetase